MVSGVSTNCTFEGNRCYGDETFGGAANIANGILTNCTFTKNKCISGTGYSNNNGGAFFGGATITNCIFWKDSADFNSEIAGTPASIKNCVIENGYPGSVPTDSIFIADPGLGTLRNNGGVVQTISISRNSSAYNNGTTNVPSGIDISADARVYPRSDGRPDIGAFEVQNGE